MAAGGGEGVKFVALAINADGSKREEELKGDKLAGGLHEIAKLAAAQAAMPEKAAEALAALHVSQQASRKAKEAIKTAREAADSAKAACEAELGDLTAIEKFREAKDKAVKAANVKWQEVEKIAKSAAESSQAAMQNAMEAAELMPDKVQLSIVTISEMSGTVALNDFVKKLGSSWKHVSHCIKSNSADRIVTAFNTDVWELIDDKEYIASDNGRYLLTKLRMNAMGMILAYFSVHLPHKTGKDDAYGSIKKVIDECCTDAAFIMIGGDWNMQPEIVTKEFGSEYQLAFKTGDGGTSAKSIENAIDNFALKNRQLYWSSSEAQLWTPSFSSKRIMNEMQVEKYTTHAPIWAEVRLTPRNEE